VRLFHVHLLFISQLAPATTSRLSVYPHQPVMLPALSTFLPPPNPSAPTFAGWFLSDGAPLGCVTQTVSLQPCCGDYRVTLDDHCYADKKCSVPGQTTDAACTSELNPSVINLPLTKEEVNVFARVYLSVCLSVCLSLSKITQNCMHGFGRNVTCRQMSGHGRTD